jgi:WD40 repeat protein
MRTKSNSRHSRFTDRHSGPSIRHSRHPLRHSRHPLRHSRESGNPGLVAKNPGKWVAGLRYVLAILSLTILAATANAESAVDFNRDIRPIFFHKCSSCHFPDAGKLKASLNLSTAEGTLKGSENGAIVEPGNAAESLLVKSLEHSAEPFMPPPDKFKKLADEEIALIRKWIDEGAPADSSAPKEVEQAEPEPSEAPAAQEAIDTSIAPVAAVAFSPDGKWLARGGLHAVEVFQIDATNGTLAPLTTLSGHTDQIRALAFSPDGSHLAAGGGKSGRSGEIKIWKTADWTEALSLEGHRDNVLDVEWSPDGKQLASCSYDKLVKIWNSETGEEIHNLKDHVDAVFAMDYSPDGSMLASAAGDRTVKLWDPKTGERILTLSDSTAPVMSVAFSPDGHHVAAGAEDKMIRVWDTARSGADFTQSGITSGVLVHSKFAHSGTVMGLAYSPDGKHLYSAADDLLIKVWNAETMEEERAFPKQSDWVLGFSLSPNGEWLAAGRYDSSLSLYEANNGRETWSSAPNAVLAMANAENEENETEAVVTKKNQGDVSRIDVDAVIVDSQTIPPSLASASVGRKERGAEFEVTVNGKNLADATAYYTDPGIQVAILENLAQPIPEFNYDAGSTGAQIFDVARPHQVKLKVTVPEKVGLGTKHLFFETPLGITDAQALEILPRPDIGEQEPNNSIEEAQSVEFPNTIQGAMNEAGDLDRFKIKAEAGKELVFVLTDTEENATLRLLDLEGNEVVSRESFGGTNQPRLGYKFSSEGEWIVEVGDPDLEQGMGYRLHIGEFPFVTSVRPLGIAAGEPKKVQVEGFNLGAPEGTLEIDPPDQAKSGTMAALPLPGYEGNSVDNPKVAVGRFEELVETDANDSPDEAQQVSFPSTINGAIERPGDLDYYRFQAEKGQVFVLETEAARLGSSLDSAIEVLTLEGESIQRAKARCVAKTMMTLSDRDSRQSGLRVENWSDFTMNDYVMVGAEIIKVNKIPDYGDQDMQFYDYNSGQRMTYFGTTPEHHAVNTPVYKVEIHPTDATFAPNGMPVYPLFWRNDDFHYSGRNGDSYLRFEAPETGDYLVQVRDVISGGGPDHPYRLHLRPMEPDFSVSAFPYRMNLHAGSRIPLTVKVDRFDDFTGPVKIEAHDLPDGLSIESADILEGELTVDLALVASADARSTGRDDRFKITATTAIEGNEIVRETYIGRIMVVDEKPDLVVRNDVDKVTLKPGETVRLGLSVERNNGYSGRIPIDLLDLPYGVRILDKGLNGILVRENEYDRTIEVFAEPWVKPVERDLYFQARIEARTTDRMRYLGPPIRLSVVPGNPTASNLAKADGE